MKQLWNKVQDYFDLTPKITNKLGIELAGMQIECEGALMADVEGDTVTISLPVSKQIRITNLRKRVQV